MYQHIYHLTYLTFTSHTFYLTFHLTIDLPIHFTHFIHLTISGVISEQPKSTFTTSWSKTYKSIIDQCLENEKVFQAYLLNDSNVQNVFKTFKRLIKVFSRTKKKQKQLAAKVATLKKELAELNNIIAEQKRIVAEMAMLKKKVEK